MRVNFQMTDLCRATTGLAIIVLDSHHNFIDVLILSWSPIYLPFVLFALGRPGARCYMKGYAQAACPIRRPD
jgi:hypothetical protein